MSDTPTGETVNAGDSQTTVTTSTAPAANVVDPAEAERLRKESEQKDLRIRQLLNEKEARDKAEADAKAKALEENNEFKSLYEQTNAKLQQIEDEKAESARKAEIESASSDVLKDFPDAVKEIAKETGLSALDNSEEAKAEFKAKLDKINAKLPQIQVSANNPGRPTPTNNNLSSDDMKIALKNENNFHDLASKLPGVNAMLTKRS